MQPEEVDQLRAPRRFAGAHKLVVSRERVDCAGLARVGTSRECDFGTGIRRALRQAGCADQKLCRFEIDLGQNESTGQTWTPSGDAWSVIVSSNLG